MAAGDLCRRPDRRAGRRGAGRHPVPGQAGPSAKGKLAIRGAENAWALPRLEFEINVDDPFTDDVLAGLFGIEHRVRFVTGSEAVIDTRVDQQVRVRAIEFR